MTTKDAAERLKIKVERQNHVKQVMADRKVYHDWRRRCRLHPEKYLCVILDGMDQNKTNIPNFGTEEQLTDVTVRVIGAICHGATKDVSAFLVTHYTKETTPCSRCFGVYWNLGTPYLRLWYYN